MSVGKKIIGEQSKFINTTTSQKPKKIGNKIFHYMFRIRYIFVRVNNHTLDTK